MANVQFTLPPVMSKRLSPIYSVKPTSIAGTEHIDFKAGYNLEVPNHYVLQSLIVIVTTDATVANRYLNIVRYDGQASSQMEYYRTSAIPASQLKYINCVQEALPADLGFLSQANADLMMLPLGKYSFMIRGDDFIRIDLNTGKAGDTMQVSAQFRWMNWELQVALPELFATAGWNKLRQAGLV